jgi:DNA primase
MRDDPTSDKHGVHHCWSCSYSGTVIDLAMYVLGLPSWAEAREWVGGDAAIIEPPPAAVDVKVGRVRVATGFRLPVGVEVAALDEWPDMPRRYALARGITEAQVERWGIGYAVEGRLAGRVVVVKRDSSGEPCGYSARTFVDDRRRYLEPEPHERPRHVVFGEQHWPRALGEVYVTEGAFNALAVERAIPGASIAAVSGSQLSPIIAARLARARKIVIVSDPDAAGDKLAGAIVAALARTHIEVTRARLPNGQDAASMNIGDLAAAIERAA